MPDTTIRRSRIILLAVAMGLFFTAQPLTMQLASGRPVSVQRDLLQELFYWLVWALLSPLIIAAARRWPLDAQHARRSVGVHMVIAVILAPLQAIVAFALHLGEMYLAGAISAADIGPLIQQRRILVLWGFFTGAYFYWVIVAICTALHFRELYAAERISVADLGVRRAALEGELMRARLDALQSQLQPHFLFNTLNAIAVLAEEDVGKARQMLFRLGSLLRRSLDETRHEVPLSQELRFLEEYLDIQRVRFGDRLAITLDIDPATLAALVPVFSLQPLAENAIAHGAARGGGPTRIAVRTMRDDRAVRISIQDNGPGPGTTLLREGVGLRNTRERLQRLHGAQATLVLGAAMPPGTAGARVEMCLPLQDLPACAS